MTLPSLPATPMQVFVVVGIALVVAAVVYPTASYEAYEELRAEVDKQEALLEVEEEYSDLAPEPRARLKELAVMRIELEWLKARRTMLEDRWAKQSTLSIYIGLGGVVLAVLGMWLWWPKKATKTEPRAATV